MSGGIHVPGGFGVSARNKAGQHRPQFSPARVAESESQTPNTGHYSKNTLFFDLDSTTWGCRQTLTPPWHLPIAPVLFALAAPTKHLNRVSSPGNSARPSWDLEDTCLRGVGGLGGEDDWNDTASAARSP